MLQLSELLSPRPEALWTLIRQCGVTNVVALLDGAEQDQRMFAAVGRNGSAGAKSHGAPWAEDAIRKDMDLFEAHGFTVVAIEDTPAMDQVRMGLAGRDEQIEQILVQIRAMGRLGIPTLCYNWMAMSSWGRTDTEIEGRGGALVTGYRAADADAMPPLVAPGEITEAQLWESLQYFFDAVMPVAEESGVRLGMHPDDPPRPSHRGIPRIMTSPEAYRRLLDMYPSPSNAITFCQGNFALMGSDLPTLIEEFGGRGQIAFVHFRDIRGSAQDFRETFHDEGQTDLVACMRAYAGTGYAGPMRPDHVPTMHGESNDRPAYGSLGRLFALGYLRGLEHSAYGKPGAAR